MRKKRHCKVDYCGLFIDENNPFLAASPDELVGEDGLVEVKCLYSINEKLKEAENKSTRCFEIIDNEIRLKKNHNYFYQIQGQLNITKRKYCDFVIYTKNDFSIERIHRDFYVWETKILPKLKSFYLNAMGIIYK